MTDQNIADGERLFAEGRLQEAKARFQAVIDKEPNNIQALNNLGVIDLLSGISVQSDGPQDLAGAERFLRSYSIADTRVGPFLVANRDMVVRRVLSQGVLFGHEEVNQAVQTLRELSSGWRPGNFIDIGANIGTHSVYAAKLHGFEKGVAIEIDPENFRVLRCNLILAGIDEQVLAVNCGLSSTAGSCELERSPSNMGDHRVRLDDGVGPDLHDEHSWQRVSCALQTFDETVPAELLGRESLVWIDTQGHESHVLRGAKNLFSSGTPFVMEFWPYGLVRQGCSCAEITEQLSSCTVYDLHDGLRQLSGNNLRDLFDCFLSEERKNHSPNTDLLVLP